MTTKLFEKYAVNETEIEVQLIDSTIKIAGKGWEGLTDKETVHPDVIYALRKRWISLKDNEPKTPQKPEKPKIQTRTAESPEYAGEKEPRVKVSKLGT